MPLYEHDSGERVRAVAGSAEDRRLRDSSRWTSVTSAPPADPQRPAEDDRKQAWIDYARGCGLPSYEIDALTKAELIERTATDGQD